MLLINSTIMCMRIMFRMKGYDIKLSIYIKLKFKRKKYFLDAQYGDCLQYARFCVTVW